MTVLTRVWHWLVRLVGRRPPALPPPAGDKPKDIYPLW